MSKFRQLLHNKIFMGWFTVTFGGIGIFIVSKIYMTGLKAERFGTLDDTDYRAGAFEGEPTAERVSKYQGGGNSKMGRLTGDVLGWSLTGPARAHDRVTPYKSDKE